MLSLPQLLITVIEFYVLIGTALALSHIQSACQVCSQVLGPSKFISSTSEVYTNETEFNWSPTCWLQPSCIVSIKNTTDVATVLKIINQYQVPFAVRSGGHNPNSGFGSVNSSGILIDLAQLNTLSIDSSTSTVSVGPGNQWIDVYNFLDSYNVSAIGTKEPVPGVGGSVLGGGDPFFPNLYGMICDNVKNFEVVLSNSSVVQANAQQNTDLFKALKGGGPNLGIVTRYDLFTVPLHNVWSTYVVYNSTHNPELLQALATYQSLATSDRKSNVIFNLLGSVTVIGFLYASHVSSPSIFDSFSNIPHTSVYSPPLNSTVAELSALVGSFDGTTVSRHGIYAVSSTVDLSTYSDTLAKYEAALPLLPTNTTLLLTLQPYGPAAVAAGQQRGGNVLGIVSQPQTWFALAASWSSADDDSSVQNIISKLGSGIRTAAVTRKSALDFVFQNDASSSQRPLEGIGEANLQALRDASAKWDSLGVFQRLQNGGFLVGKE